MSGDVLMDFALYGGAHDGAIVAMPLLPPERTYLVKGEPENGRQQVWAYRFANRTDPLGRWILEPVRYVGYVGISGEGGPA